MERSAIGERINAARVRVEASVVAGRPGAWTHDAEESACGSSGKGRASALIAGR